MKTNDKKSIGTSESITPSTPQTTSTGKPRSSRGRKNKRNNPELVRLLEEALVAGLTQKVACELARIHPATLCAWMKEGEQAGEGTVAHEFYERIKRAGTEAIFRNVRLIQKHAEKHWQAAAWFLERRCPEEWALKQRVEHSGPGGKPIPVQEEPQPTPRVKMPLEKMEAILERSILLRAQAKARGIKL